MHRGVAAAAGRHLEEASARGALEEVSEAARSAARAGWFSAGAFWCAVAATAPGLAQEARWSAEQSEGIVGAMVAAAAHSWGRSSGGGGSESQAGRLVRALGRMARAGLVGVVTPGVVGAEWTEVGDRAVEFLAWAAGDAGEGDAVSAEAAAAAGQVVAGPEGRRHLAMAQGGGWDPGRAVRRAYTSASERAAMMAARLHGGLTCAVAGACGRKLWRETAVAARALAAVASATPMRCLPARVLEDERRAVVDGLGRAAEAWSGGEESAGAALESLVRCLSGCLSVGGARRGEEDEEELRRLGDLLLELGEREGAAQLRLEALVALRGAAQEMEGAWGREGDVVRLASTLLRQGREELDVKAAQQALQVRWD